MWTWLLVIGARISYPGDPGAPAGEIINCRCTTAPVIRLEKSRALRHNNAWAVRHVAVQQPVGNLH